MNEADWLASSEIEPMLHCLFSRLPTLKGTDRKAQLLIDALMKSVLNHVSPECRDLIDLIEKQANGSAGPEEVEAAFAIAERSSHAPLVFAIGYHDLDVACAEAARILGGSVAGEGMPCASYLEPGIESAMAILRNCPRH